LEWFAESGKLKKKRKARYRDGFPALDAWQPTQPTPSVANGRLLMSCVATASSY